MPSQDFTLHPYFWHLRPNCLHSAALSRLQWKLPAIAIRRPAQRIPKTRQTEVINCFPYTFPYKSVSTHARQPNPKRPNCNLFFRPHCTPLPADMSRTIPIQPYVRLCPYCNILTTHHLCETKILLVFLIVLFVKHSSCRLSMTISTHCTHKRLCYSLLHYITTNTGFPRRQQRPLSSPD